MSLKLSDLSVGECAEISSLVCRGAARCRLMDIGMTKNAPVRCLMRSPGGGISAYSVRGCVVAVRREDADNICISKRGNPAYF